MRMANRMAAISGPQVWKVTSASCRRLCCGARKKVRRRMRHQHISVRGATLSKSITAAGAVARLALKIGLIGNEWSARRSRGKRPLNRELRALGPSAPTPIKCTALRRRTAARSVVDGCGDDMETRRQSVKASSNRPAGLSASKRRDPCRRARRSSHTLTRCAASLTCRRSLPRGRRLGAGIARGDRVMSMGRSWHPRAC